MRTIFPIVAALLLAAQSALAQTENQTVPEGAPFAAETVSPGDVGAGSLLLRTPEIGRFMPAPTVATDVHMQISGMIARVRVTQRFENPGNTWTEGIYVFPLPETAAVDRMRMHIGERVVEGRIEERAEAKRVYQAARQSGRRAALIEQERPNIFTTSVANIGPKDSVSVEIEYQQSLRYLNTEFSLRFPMVVAPRYIPGPPVLREETLAGFQGTGWSADTDQVPDASRITPPVLHPDESAINPVTLKVDLDAGFPLARIESLSHAVTIDQNGTGRASVHFANGSEPAERDFVLAWSTQVGDAPRAALFTEDIAGETYAMLMVMPPQAPPTRTVLRREVIFVIDTSGSMGGASIRQAKRALKFAVERLRDGDRFNVIEFNSHTRLLFNVPRPASYLSREQALHWVAALDAGGGTEMKPAIEAALNHDPGARGVRQVVFLTDGAVGNEDALFKLIHERLGASRLFTVGIGSAPNAHFMRRAATFGRGTFTYIGTVNEVGEKMATLFRKLESPVMQGIEIRWPDFAGGVEVFPARLPDLYAGEPLIVTARLPRMGNQVEIQGVRASETWRVAIPLTGGSSQAGVGVLFARSKIASLMQGTTRGADEALIRRTVIEVALEHHLVSKYTSLVAVDVTPARPDEIDAVTRAVRTNLPAGWHYDKVFGPAPGTATPAPLNLLAGACLTVLGLLLLAGGGIRWRQSA
ncbi:MAG: marine proteobacterial sortase target protein [Gammaproteobacteria bacterium]|nr:marine proteobacterial sortase target protein [Gammaproteobacteria bacterium]MDH3413524.1 marine proteobacterial sortase target protein [Gammaproteobacteria bacterium]